MTSEADTALSVTVNVRFLLPELPSVVVTSLIVSDGRKHPWRVKVRPPCYNIYQAYPHMIKGGLIADAVAIIGGLNVVAGELDR